MPNREYLPPRSRPLADIYTDLREDPPASKLATKSTGRFSATYMHHAVVRDFLDLYAPGWEWTVRLQHIGGLLYCIGTLTLWGTDAEGRMVSVSRDGTGNERDEVSGYGDPSSNAEAQALRRAAMAHGFCRALWRK
ncbi:MAG: hypothetical protein AAF791_09975 [Bacteroidota bacterium]